MSYARFGSENSDVYVFASVHGGLECCGCGLQERIWVDDTSRFGGGYLKAVGEIVPHVFPTTAEMLSHLDCHVAAGDVVPSSCREGLLADAAENDARFRS